MRTVADETSTVAPEPVVIPAAELAAFCAQILAAAGSAPDEARRVVDRLIVANLTGHDSHGIGRIPRYVGLMQKGAVVPNRSATIVTDGGALALLDGHQGFGQILGEEAVAAGCVRARDAGIAVIGLRNAGHLGRIGDWAEAAAAEGFISIHFVNVRGRSLVAPFGGIDRRMATSPFAVGVPLSGEPPIILDFATSLIAEGKVMVAAAGGLPLRRGVLISADGLPSNDPADLYGATVGDVSPDPARGPGALATFGEHKGSGLNFMIEVLAGALTGGGVNRTLKVDEDRPFANGMLSIYLDPERFAGRAAFEQEVRDYAAYVRSARPAAGHDAVLIPGDKERSTRAERERSGIPLSAGTWDRLVSVAAALGIESPGLASR